MKKKLTIDFYRLSSLSIDHQYSVAEHRERSEKNKRPNSVLFSLLSWISLKWNLKCTECITIKALFVCLYCLRQYMTNTTIAQLGQRGTSAGNLIGYGWETTVHWAVTYHVSTSCTHCTYLVRERSFLRDSIQSSLRGRVKMISLKLLKIDVYSSTSIEELIVQSLNYRSFWSAVLRNDERWKLPHTPDMHRLCILFRGSYSTRDVS